MLLFGEDGRLQRVLLDLSVVTPKYGGPDGIAIDASGRLCVCDRTRGAIWVLESLSSEKPAREIYTRLGNDPLAVPALRPRHRVRAASRSPSLLR